MKTFLLLTLTAIFSTSILLACSAATTDTIPPISQTAPIPVKKTMKAFCFRTGAAALFQGAGRKIQTRKQSKGGEYGLRFGPGY